MKHIALLFFIGISLLGCQKETVKFAIDSKFDCLENELELTIAEGCCDVTPNFFTCEIIEVSDINTIDAQHVGIVPSVCLDIDSELVFNSGDEETIFFLRNKKHYLLREVVATSCSGFFENLSYIEQSNEIVELAFLNEMFGLDTIRIELRSIISSHQDQTPGPKADRYTLHHKNLYSDIPNFYFTHRMGDVDFDHQSKTYHDSIVLNDKVYESVIEFKVRETFHASPHQRLYVSNELGFFGFETDQKLWIKN